MTASNVQFRKSLKIPGDTRWGSHFRMVDAVSNSRLSFHNLMLITSEEVQERNAYPWDKTINSLLKSDEIWNDLPFIHRVLEEFNKILDKFYSDVPTLGDVLSVIKVIRTETIHDLFSWKEGLLETIKQYTLISHQKITGKSLQARLDDRLNMMHSDKGFLADLLYTRHMGQSFSSNQYTRVKGFLKSL